jgi:hypothetical protein
MRQDNIQADTCLLDSFIPTASNIPNTIQDKLKSGKGHTKMQAQLAYGENEAAMQAKQIKLLKICQQVLDHMNVHTYEH